MQVSVTTEDSLGHPTWPPAAILGTELNLTSLMSMMGGYNANQTEIHIYRVKSIGVLVPPVAHTQTHSKTSCIRIWSQIPALLAECVASN